MTSNGTFTAKLQQGSRSLAFSGRFSIAGQSFNTIARPGLAPLTVQLQLGLAGSALTGQVSADSWTAALAAGPAYRLHSQPRPAGRQDTLAIPGAGDGSTQPGGDGFGSVTVDADGNVSFSELADAQSTTAGKVTGQGEWPFYAPLYAGAGSIIGWLAFETNGDIGGQLNWVKPALPTGRYYCAGFTNSTGAIGSVYRATNGLPVLGFTPGN